MDERRKHRRKIVNSRVKIFHPSFGSVETRTRDISDSGILIIPLAESEQAGIQINDELKLIFLDSGEKDIVFNMDIVRIMDEGIASRFLNCEKNGEICSISALRKVWGNSND